jgi:hypothetical protein
MEGAGAAAGKLDWSGTVILIPVKIKATRALQECAEAHPHIE